MNKDFFSNIANSVDKLADFKASIVPLYDKMISEGDITDQQVINVLAQLRAKTDITLKEIG